MTATNNARTLIIWIFAVIIIVALAMSLSRLRDSFSGNTTVSNEHDDAPEATAEEPITLSSNEIIIKQGNVQTIIIGVYNPTDEPAYDISPILNCDDHTITSEIINPMNINPKENTQITMLIKTTKRTLKEIHLCNIRLNEALSSTKSTELIIRII